MKNKIKGLEALDRCVRFNKVELHDDSFQKDLDTIEKELKALEIFKAKQIDILALRISESANEYNRIVKIFGSNLTKEEYDLLKEVLGE